MTGAMMRAAECQQVLRLMIAAFFARLNVVHVDESRMPAARYLATVLVPSQYRTPHPRRNSLARFDNVIGLTHAGKLGVTHVGMRKDLRVAVCHRRHFC